MSNQDMRGVYRKFFVERLDGKEKHKDCRYFVLDLDHDPHAAAAIKAYAESCEETRPMLSAHLRHGPKKVANALRFMDEDDREEG